LGTPEQFYELANQRPVDSRGKTVVDVAQVPAGEAGQGGYAEVLTVPGATATAAAPKPSEMTPEDRRVREYVQSQRFYSDQRGAPRIGPGSREDEMGQRMEMIAEGVRRNPFINPLAPTIGAIEGGVAGVRRVGEGVKDLSQGELVKGGLKTVLGAAETGFSTAMAMSPVANTGFTVAAEVAPELAEPAMAPITYLAKPKTEGGKLAAMIGDVAVSMATLHLANKVSPAIAARIKEKIDSRSPLSAEEELFLTRLQAGDQRIANAEYRGAGRRMAAELESEISTANQARTEAKARMEADLRRQLSDAEFDMMMERRDKTVRPFSEPARLVTPGGSSEVLPSAVIDQQGKPIPLTPVRQARAPLSTPERPSFPYEGSRSVIDEAAVRGGIELPVVPENVRERVAVSGGVGKGDVARAVAAPLMAQAIQYTDLDEETKSQIERGLLFAGIGALGAKFINGRKLLAIAKKGRDFIVSSKTGEIGKFKTEEAAQQFAQQEAGISAIAVSPFFDTKVVGAADAATLRKSDGYKKQQKILSDVAQRMGISIASVKDNIGGWNNFKEISNTVALKTADMEKAENYAAVVGALANETQEATIAARYLDPSKHRLSDNIVTAVEHEIPFKDSEKALKSLDAAGLTDFTLDESGKRIVILDFGKGEDFAFREKLVNLVGQLKKEDNLNGNPEHSYTQSTYVGADERGAILSKLGVKFEPSKGGSSFGDLIQTAKQSHEEFQRKKDPVGSQYNVRQIDDNTRVYSHKGGPLDVDSLPIKEVAKDNASSFEVSPPSRPKGAPVSFGSLADAHEFVSRYRELAKEYPARAAEFVDNVVKMNRLPGSAALKTFAGAAYGIEKDDEAEGGFRINPTKFALGMLGASALASVRLNPGIREKLARAVGRTAASMTDGEIVAAYEKLSKGREVSVRKPNEKLYVENVNVEKFSDPAAATEALTGITQRKIDNSRAKMTDVEITELAKKQGDFIKRISEGKVVPREAYLVEEVRAMKSEMDRVLSSNSGKPFKEWSAEDKNIANVARAFIGAAAEGGRLLREFGRPVEHEVAAFLKSIDPAVEIAEKDMPTILDKIAEFGGAVKLASASGIIRSTVGNAVSRALYYPELVTSVGANKLIAKMFGKGRDRFAEEAAVNQIVGKSTVMKALGTAMDILKGDPASIAQNEFLKSEGYSVEGAIGGRLGHIIRTPYRAQGAVDAVFREPLRDMELSRIAIREAYKTAKAGEKTESIVSRAQDYFDNAPEEWKTIADERAKYYTFQNKGGAMLQGVNAIRSSTPVVRWFVPFFNTGMNLTKYAIERTPLAPLTPSFIQATWEAVAKAGSDGLTPMQKSLAKMTGKKFEAGQIGDLSDKVGRMVAGSALLFALPVITDKVLGGEIVGNFPEDRNESEAWKAQGKLPYSIKIGGYYIPYRGYEPLSSFLSAYAEYARSKGETGSRSQAAVSAFSSLVKSVTENPSLVGINDIINALSEEGGLTEKTNKAVASFLTGMVVPTIVRQSVSIVDPRVLDAQGVAENMQRVIPGITGNIPAKMDALGRELDIDKPWAKLAGVTMGKENLGVVEQEFARLKYSPLPPEDKYAGTKLTREQVQALRKSAGKGLAQALGTFMESPQYKNIPDDIKIAVIDEIKNKVYEAQRVAIIPKEIVRGRIGGKRFLSGDQKEAMQEGVSE
jgi:hypothetical protein